MIRPLFWLPLVALSLGTVSTYAQDLDLEQRARELHKLAGADYCDDIENDPVGDGYNSWDISYQPDWTDDEEQKQSVTLIEMFCFAGAYNLSYHYYLYDDIQGLRPIAFARPDFDVQYENDDFEGTVLGITVTGYLAGRELVNPELDLEQLLISDNSRWRGLGDASSTGVWKFEQGEFRLQTYMVDASYDGEINPETLVDFSKKKSK